MQPCMTPQLYTSSHITPKSTARCVGAEQKQKKQEKRPQIFPPPVSTAAASKKKRKGNPTHPNPSFVFVGRKNLSTISAHLGPCRSTTATRAFPAPLIATPCAHTVPTGADTERLSPPTPFTCPNVSQSDEPGPPAKPKKSLLWSFYTCSSNGHEFPFSMFL